MRVFRVGVCVSACVLAIAIVLGARVETQSVLQSAVVDAATGFDMESNGFAEEFCANQDDRVQHDAREA